MDGFEFAETLRRNEAWRGVPIVVMTAMDLTDEDRQRLNGRVQSVVQKSGQSLEVLLRQVRERVVACARLDNSTRTTRDVFGPTGSSGC